MQHITGIPRNQLFFLVRDTILPENPVRFIDAFVKPYHYKLRFFQTIKGKVARALILKSFLQFIVWVSKWSAGARKLERSAHVSIAMAFICIMQLP
jgi:hypothetical protein